MTKIEQELNKLADVWVVDGSEIFTGDDEMIAKQNFKDDISVLLNGLLRAQKDAYLEYIKGERLRNPIRQDQVSFNQGINTAIQMIEDSKV